MDEKYKLYDELLATLYINIEVEAARDERIYISGYKDDAVCNTYMKMVEAKADIDGTPIIMLMPLISYIEFIFSHWKVRKRYKWAKNFQQLIAEVTPMRTIAKFVADYYEQPITIYEDIYKEFYA